MITAINLKNFKCFDNCNIRFETKRGFAKKSIIILGDNATGKTSLIESFLLINQLIYTLKVKFSDAENYVSMRDMVLKNKRWKSSENIYILAWNFQ